MEGLTNDEEDLIFEIELELLLIGTIIVLEEIVSLSSVGVSKLKAFRNMIKSKGH
jgi:hypothetical protein